MHDSWLARSLKSRAGLLQWVSIVAAVAFIAWILVSRGDDLEAAFSLTPGLFVLISVSALFTFLVNGIELKVLVTRFGNAVPLRDAMLLGLMTSTLNYLPLKAGTMLNGVILRVRYGLKLSHFAALVAGSSVIHLWTALVLSGCALVANGQTRLGSLLAVAPTVALIALIVWGRLRSAGKLDGHHSRFVRAMGRAVDGMGLIFSSPRLLAIETALNLTLVVLASLRTYWSFQALSVDMSMAASIVVTGIGIVAARLSVIPGGIGFKEGGAATGAAMAGVDPGLGLAASVIDRAVTLVWLLALGVPATIYMQRSTGVDLETASEYESEGGAERASDNGVASEAAAAGAGVNEAATAPRSEAADARASEAADAPEGGGV